MVQRGRGAWVLRVCVVELKWLRRSGVSVCVHKKMTGKGLNTADIKISSLQHMEMMEKAILFASPQMDFSQCCANWGRRHPTALCSTIMVASRQPIEVFRFLNWKEIKEFVVLSWALLRRAGALFPHFLGGWKTAVASNQRSFSYGLLPYLLNDSTLLCIQTLGMQRKGFVSSSPNGLNRSCRQCLRVLLNEQRFAKRLKVNSYSWVSLLRMAGGKIMVTWCSGASYRLPWLLAY